MPQRGYVTSHQTDAVARGGRENALQRGNCRNPHGDSCTLLLLESLPSPRKGQRQETSDQLEEVELLCSVKEPPPHTTGCRQA